MDIMPLVSILIPTFNRPQYFELALISAINQSYKNIEIIICDDSTNNFTKKIVEKYTKTYKNIRYCFNNGPLGNFGVENYKKCFDLANGEYISYLNDDDLYNSRKIEIMMKYFLKYENVSLVTSHRQPINKKGNNIDGIGITRRIYEMPIKIDGKKAAKNIFIYGNYIGEPTTVLFKKNLIDGIGLLESRQYYALIDIASWLKLLSKGSLVYLPETLSYYRIHETQNSKKHEIVARIDIDSVFMMNYAYNAKFISKAEYMGFANNWKNKIKKIVTTTKENEMYEAYSKDILEINNIFSKILNETEGMKNS